MSMGGKRWRNTSGRPLVDLVDRRPTGPLDPNSRPSLSSYWPAEWTADGLERGVGGQL